MNQTSYHDKKSLAEEFCTKDRLTRIFQAAFPAFESFIAASEADDILGVDFWVRRTGLVTISVDVKVRDVDPIERWGSDDLALEVWSVVEKNVPGWSVDNRKYTDYILWIFPTGRWVMFSFPMLCQVAVANMDDWVKTYKTAQQVTKGNSSSYHSECVFVPRKVVWRAIYDLYGGEGS